MNFAADLRGELIARAEKYAAALELPYSLTFGDCPSVCFAPHKEELRHGNFIQPSYRAISANSSWLRRLGKVHTQGWRSLPVTERGRWMELDSCTSSDALLMNIFCHPRVSRNQEIRALLGVEECAANPVFGYRARVPFANGRFDRTEVDMKIGNLLVESKLTEFDFQRAEKRVLDSYRDFHQVFDCESLRQTDKHYFAYQLIRNVLAAHALCCSFCVLLDARRPDLLEAWYAVMKCVKPVTLRTALQVLTWQELTASLPIRLKVFLKLKYGIQTFT